MLILTINQYKKQKKTLICNIQMNIKQTQNQCKMDNVETSIIYHLQWRKKVTDPLA